MMMKLSCDVISALQSKTLATAESCTGGMIGAALTSVPGSSNMYKGGIISYTNEIKTEVLAVSKDTLNRKGAVSAQTAKEMAIGARRLMNTDYAISVTGLAGPGGDDFGNPVGSVYIGFTDGYSTDCKHYIFNGDRADVRRQTTIAALQMIIEKIG